MSTLINLAREAGASGVTWNDWTSSDEVQALIDSHEGSRGRLFRDCEKAYAEGRHELLRKTWVTVWTTAPEDYDSFGTETVSHGGPWRGKELREVLIDPHHENYQRDRYGSGLHGSWRGDPRVEEQREDTQRAEELVARQVREAKQAAGIVFLAGLSEKQLDRASEGDFDESLEAYCLGWTHVREEKKIRQQFREKQERAQAWEKCRPLIPPDCVLVDDGDEGGYSSEGEYAYRRPHRDARVYYEIGVIELEQDVERSYVMHGRESLGSIADIAYQIENGRLRAADPSSIPPKKVLDRIGHDQLKEIKRLEIKGRIVWVGRARFSYEHMILDDQGRLVRAKAVVAEALKAIKM